MEVVFVIKKNVSNPGVNLLITWDSTGYNEQKLIWGSLSKKGDFVLKVRECVIKSKGRHTNYGLNSNQGMGVHRRSLCVGLCTLAQSSFCGLVSTASSHSSYQKHGVGHILWFHFLRWGGSHTEAGILIAFPVSCEKGFIGSAWDRRMLLVQASMVSESSHIVQKRLSGVLLRWPCRWQWD